MDTKVSKVTVMGLGVNGGGIGVVLYFLKQGYEVIVTDLKTAEELKGSIQRLKNEVKNPQNLKCVLGEHKEEDFKNVDMVVKNPAVPWNNCWIKLALDNKVQVTTEMELFFEQILKLRNRGQKISLIGITGTRGKSTTASLIYEMLKENYSKVFLVGNIGKSALEIIKNLSQEGGIVVMELSSFQLDRLKFSPNISIVTNIYEDHLNYHGSFSKYLNAKKNIVKHQKKEDWAVLNHDNLLVREFGNNLVSKISYFSVNRPEFDVHFEGDVLRWGKDGKIELTEISLKGNHNLENILATVTAIMKFDKVSDTSIKKVLKTFKGLFGRQEILGEKKGLIWVNDTTSTMPEALGMALDTFGDRTMHLISGGNDKNLDYEMLSSHITANIKSVSLLPGTATPKLQKIFEKVKSMEIVEVVNTLDRAACNILKRANKGDWVIFSPGAASFGSFTNEFERGKYFENLIKRL